MNVVNCKLERSVFYLSMIQSRDFEVFNYNCLGKMIWLLL